MRSSVLCKGDESSSSVRAVTLSTCDRCGQTTTYTSTQKKQQDDASRKSNMLHDAADDLQIWTADSCACTTTISTYYLQIHIRFHLRTNPTIISINPHPSQSSHRRPLLPSTCLCDERTVVLAEHTSQRAPALHASKRA